MSSCHIQRIVASPSGAWHRFSSCHSINARAAHAGATAASITMPLDFAKTVLQCGSELPIHRVLKQTLADKGPAGLFTGMVRLRFRS